MNTDDIKCKKLDQVSWKFTNKKKKHSCCSWVKKQKIVYQTVSSIADKFTNGYCRELSGLDSTHVRDLPAAK